MALEISTNIGYVLSQSTGIVRGQDAAPRQANSLTDSHPPATDTVELSAYLRDIQHVNRVVQETPEVREDLVVNARHAFTANALTLAGETLADKLLSEQLSRN